MLNMVDFSTYSVADSSVLFILHIVYVFVVAILLVNFLIALLSTSAGKVQENQDIILMVQRLSVINTVEERFMKMFSWYYQRICKYLCVEENGRIYLVTIRTNINRENNENSLHVSKVVVN